MAPSYGISTWIFTRALSLIYLIAFVSLFVQVKGLWGSQGVLPIQGFLKSVESQIDTSRYWKLPTVFWFSSTDQVLVGAAALGAIAALGALVGFAQGWMLATCFLLYLSFTVAGQEFMSFQWDALLLEVGFFALFAVSWNFRMELNLVYEPHWFVRYGFYIILFKLMFLSGVVKILSGDTSWRDLTALSYHYWTQPLPNFLSPFVHRLPIWAHQGATAATFAIELAFPFLIWWPRARAFAAIGFIGLSFMILLTGNYTFFNWLTIALCIWLISDQTWEAWIGNWPWNLHILHPVVAPHPLITSVVSVLILASVIWCTRYFYPPSWNSTLGPLLGSLQRFHISSSYGLFANMTKTRPEIVIEGSADGKQWQEYEFKYKPGNLYRPPPIVAPHQPRLDWQMWFAALGSMRENTWVQNLFVRLFENSQDTLDLLAWNPFPVQPPKYLRARLYEYEFTTPKEILQAGQWWKRNLIGEYSGVRTFGTTQRQ